MKLNLGAGGCPLAGDCINVDLAYDELFDPTRLPYPEIIKSKQPVYPLPDGYAEMFSEVRASHVLEHFGHRETFAVLTDWVRCLAPGGLLKIAVPDFRKIIAAYEARDPLAEAYCYGGQTDELDFHKAGFDEDSLRGAFEALGLVDIQPWNDGARDCSSLPVSLNLCGRKPGGDTQQTTPDEPEGEPETEVIQAQVDLSGILAVMTAPRLGFTDASHVHYKAFGGLGVPLIRSGGVFWDQGITRIIEQAIEQGVRYVITLDYDSLFTKEDVVRLLWIMDTHPDLDAVAALQMRRELNSPLFHTGKVKKAGEWTELTLGADDLDKETLPCVTAHFGLTVFRASSFERVGKPWFHAIPDAEGSWGEGRMDSDIAFWHRWQQAGNTVATALRVPIGHLELVSAWPDSGMQRRFQNLQDYERTGKPEWAWS